MPKQFGIPEDIVSSVVAGRERPSVYSPYLAALHDRHTIAVNNAYMIGDWMDALFFGDCAWYVQHRIALERWPKLKVTCCQRFAAYPESQANGLKYLGKDKTKSLGISTNPTTVCWNSNSGSAAISLAAHLGAKRIILLGFDMIMDRGKTHWHAPHSPIKRNFTPPYVKHLKGFPQIAEDAKLLGIEILNASPISAIKDFPKVSVSEIINESSSFRKVEPALVSE